MAPVPTSLQAAPPQLPPAGARWLVWSVAAAVLLAGMATIWPWTIDAARQTRRTRTLLAAEPVLTHGQVLSIDYSWWGWFRGSTDYGFEGYPIWYQFVDGAGRSWRGRGRGFLSVEARTGAEVLLVTYARSDPSANRLGNHTGPRLRGDLERSAVLLPLLILVLQGGGLSLVLTRLVLAASRRALDLLR